MGHIAGRRSFGSPWSAIGRLLAVAIVAGCTSAVPVPSPTPGIARPTSGWTFAGALLRHDGDDFAGSVMRVHALADGGWLVLRQELQPYPRSPGPYGPLLPARSLVLRVDATGREVAREQDPRRFFELQVFERAGVIVGPASLGGYFYAVRISDLTPVATLPEQLILARDGERLFTFASYPSRAGLTELVERDPATLAEIARYPHITLDGVTRAPVVMTTLNAVLWNQLATGVAARPLDPTRPIGVPPSVISGACSVEAAGGGRLALWRAPTCEQADLWTMEVLEAATGRRVFRSSDFAVSGNALPSSLVSFDLHQTVDSAGRLTPAVPGPLVSTVPPIDFAVVRLSAGGAAVLRRGRTSGQTPTAHRVVATRECPVDFQRVVMSTSTGCPALAGHGGSRRLFLSPGRQSLATTMTVTGVSVDAAAHIIEFRYTHDRGVDLRPTAPAAVVELPGLSSGSWLVHAVREQAGVALWTESFDGVLDVP